MMVVLTTVGAIRRYDAELVGAARELRTLDLLLAEEAGRSLQSVQLILDNVAGQVAADGIGSPDAFVERMSTKSVHDALQAHVAGVPQLDAVTLISVRGKLTNFSRTWPIPDVDLSDRDYFRKLREGSSNQTYLTEPVLNRGSGTPTIYLARRIEAPDGTLLGLVLGAIELSYFDRFYASLHLDPGNFIALWREDGVLLARYPPAEIGQRMPLEAIQGSSPSWRGIPGVFEKTWTIGNGVPETRVVASQVTAGFPLRINLGRSTAVILADWRQEVTAVGSAVGFAVLCVLVLIWALLRRFHAYEVVAVALHESEKAIVARHEAEDALRHAQKMEAVGQLTGGVAHDFNNLLTVIRSSIDLLKRPNITEERRLRYIDAISDTTTRAAKLTGQLLAFARRQALKPEVFDAAYSVKTIGEMVGTLTGARIAIETTVSEQSCFIDADPNQFDTAMVNLAVNARDAMDGQGRLTIDVRRVESIPAVRSHAALSGDFVAVSMTDTGCGIAPAHIDRIFEPFFTTKAIGQGTGLGLSQVFGFVKQSGGELAVESEAGRGATFTLYLPRVLREERVAERSTEAELPPHGHGPLCVLVVEDNADVGSFAIQTLQELGYTSTLAGSAEEALGALAKDARRFDVMFSDVVMPGMNGIDLAEEARRRHPHLRVVLTSGYSPMLAQTGTHGFELLNKPYSIDQLSRVLQSAAQAVA